MAKTFKFNMDSTMQSTASDSVFVDVKPDSSYTLRVLPPTREDGNLYYMTANHYGFKDEEGKNRGPSCQLVDPNKDYCLFCILSDYLASIGEVDQSDDISVSNYWYPQVLVGNKDRETGEWKYSDPKLVKMSQATANKLNAIINAQYENDDDFLFEPVNGQNVSLTRNGSGKGTRYELMSVGKKNNLDDIKPGWDKKLLDPTKSLKLTAMSDDEAMQWIVRSFGNTIDWDDFQEYVNKQIGA